MFSFSPFSSYYWFFSLKVIYLPTRVGLSFDGAGDGRQAPAVVTWDRTRKSANRPSQGLHSGLYEQSMAFLYSFLYSIIIIISFSFIVSFEMLLEHYILP